MRSFGQILQGCQPLLAASLVFILTPSDAFSTPIVFSGSGIGTGGNAISASATFDFVTRDFGSGLVNAVEIRLLNTAAVTTVRGNLVTGVFFSLTPPVGGPAVGNLTTTAAGFDGRADTVRYTNGTVLTSVDIAPAVNNSATDGGYQLANGPFGTANNGQSFAGFRYGISTIGGGLAGFSGNAVNGDDYGIFAAGSNIATGNLSTTSPLIDSVATFWVKRPDGWTTVNQVTGVRITYGSLPDNYLEAPPQTPVPEPSSFALMGMGAAMTVGALRRRVRAKAV